MSRLAIPVNRTILQPLALLDYLKFTLDKDPTSAAIYGEAIIEKK